MYCATPFLCPLKIACFVAILQENYSIMSDLIRRAKVEIDGSNAGQEIEKLRKTTERLKYELSTLDKTSKTYSKDQSKLRTELQQTERELKKKQTGVENLTRVLNNLSGSTYNDLIKAQKELKRQLGDMERGTAEYETKLRSLTRVEKELKIAKQEQNSVFAKSSNFWANMAGKLAIASGVYKRVTNAVLKLTEAANEFQSTMADVYTSLDKDTFEKHHNELERGSREIMKKYGLSIQETNKALADAVSAGIEAGKATEFLDVAARLAVGGSTSLATSVDGLTSILHAYSLEVKDSESVANAFFTAQKYGKTTVEELANSIGKVAPIASQLGVSYQELMAAQSALTMKGISSNDAFMALRGALTALIKPSSEAQKVLAEAGVPFGAAAVKAAGLGATLEKLSHLVESNNDAVVRAIPNIRGLTAITALSGDGFDKYSEILQKVTSDLGENTNLSFALGLQMETTAKKMAIAKAEFRDISIELGQKLQPVVISATNALSGLMKVANVLIKTIYDNRWAIAALATYWGVLKVAEKGWIQQSWILLTRLKDLVKSLTLKQALLGSFKFIFSPLIAGYQLMAAGILTVRGRTDAANAAMKAFNTTIKNNPIGLLLTLLATVGVALTGFIRKKREATRAIKEMHTELEKEQRACNDLFSALKKVEKGSTEYKAIKEKIINQYGAYLTGLIDEKGALIDVEQAHKRVTAAIRENFAQRMVASEQEKLFTTAMKNSATNATKLGRELTKQFGQDVGTIFQNEILAMVRNGDGQSKINEFIFEKGINNNERVKMYVNELLTIEHTLQNGLVKIDEKYASWMSDFDVQNKIKALKKELEEYNKTLEIEDIQVALGSMSQSNVEEIRKKVAETTKEIQELEKRLVKVSPSANNIESSTGPSPTGDNSPSGDTPEKWSLDKDIQFLKKRREILHQHNIEEIESIEERDRLIMQEEIASYERRLTELRKHGKENAEEIAQHQAAIVSLRVKLYDEERKQKAEQDKIIASGQTPLEREIADYEARLKAAGLYNLQDLEMTEKQLEAKRILEQQHADRVATIQQRAVSDQLRNLEQAHKNEERQLANKFTLGLIKEKDYRKKLIDLDYRYWNERAKVQGLSQAEAANLEQMYQNMLIEAMQTGNEAAVKKLVSERMELLNKFYEEATQTQDIHSNDELIALGIKLGLKEEEIMKLAECEEAIEKWKNQRIEEETAKSESIIRNIRERSLKAWLKNAEETVYKIQNGINILANANQAYNDNQLARIELQKERELTAAGDSAELRKQIEEDFERKKFELQKSQADRNFAIQAAQIVATGALAAIQAFAQLGPIAGAIAAGIVAVTTGLQLASANKERQRIKAMTFQSSSGESGSPITGERVATGNAGFSDGGYTGHGGRFEPAGIVHKEEYVAPSYVLASPRAFNHVRALEALRQEYKASGRIAPSVSGFADGGPTSAATSDEEREILGQLSKVLDRLERNGVKAHMYFDEFERKQAVLHKSRSAGTRRDD